MYINITTRCNMTCAHCCMACTAEGEDMSLDTFRKALLLAGDYGEYISIGGGEPTLHPLFWQFLGESLRLEYVWLATNGSVTETAIALAALARRGVIGCALSLDRYHDAVDPRVVKAFTEGKAAANVWGGDDKDNREVRSVTRILRAGRALDFDPEDTEEECPCDMICIRPNGDVHQCGCKDSPLLGNVHDPDGLNMRWSCDCYRELEKQAEYEEAV